MSTTLSFLIRDGLETDIAKCLELDHVYQTEYVWQMRLLEETGRQQITFTRERLPRMLSNEYPASDKRLQAALAAQHGFLVAASRDHAELLGYMTIYSDPVYHIACVRDLVVSRPYRQNGIGTRLLNIARQWARENHLSQLMLEVQTKNYPAIAFCQQCGFTFCGFNDHYFANQDIAVFFSQSLR